MAAVASRRRLARNAAAVLALVGVGATGLVVAFRDDTATEARRDAVRGERLRAVLVVAMDDEPLAEATATLRLTNGSDRAAWFRGDECGGPGRPSVRPRGDRPASGPDVGDGTLRVRLIAAGATALGVELVAAGDAPCGPGGAPVRIEPDETLTREFRTGGTLVDRSSTQAVQAVVIEVDRRGRPLGRLRVRVPFPELPDARSLTVDQAVDAFLADPTVAEFVAAAGDVGMLTVVSREGDAWRLSLGTVGGDLSAKVRPDLTVTDVRHAS